MAESADIFIVLIIIILLIEVTISVLCSSCFASRFYERSLRGSGYERLSDNDSVDTLPLYNPRSYESDDPPPPYTEYPEPLLSGTQTPYLDENVFLEPLVPQDMEEPDMRGWLAMEH